MPPVLRDEFLFSGCTPWNTTCLLQFVEAILLKAGSIFPPPTLLSLKEACAVPVLSPHLSSFSASFSASLYFFFFRGYFLPRYLRVHRPKHYCIVHWPFIPLAVLQNPVASAAASIVGS
jgi:hypothetical protein